jgi:glycosyltransferase involved in cell wall biosynthesis
MTFMNAENSKVNLLIISQDVINDHLAGPGLRYIKITKYLEPEMNITLAAPQGTDPGIPHVDFFTYKDSTANLKWAAKIADVILVSGGMLQRFPFLMQCKARLVVDLYDPTLLENMYYYKDESPSRQAERNGKEVDTQNLLAQAGDYFICGSERQRDFWMGVLVANGRINPQSISKDPELRDLIDVVGIGIPSKEPNQKPILKGIHPDVPVDARIVLWGGGIWNWLDPLTLIKAWPTVIRQIPKARLVFLGTKHPNPAVPQHEMAQKAIDLAREMGELDKSILFFEWLSTRDREALLCEADVGVVCQPSSIETRYALRTRVLDYFWVKLPVVASEGDVLSEVIKEHGVGWVVPARNEHALAEALIEALNHPRDEIRQQYQELIKKYQWTNQVFPLRAYCLAQAGRGEHPRRRIPDQMRLGFRLKRKIKHLAARITPKGS